MKTFKWKSCLKPNLSDYQLKLIMKIYRFYKNHPKDIKHIDILDLSRMFLFSFDPDHTLFNIVNKGISLELQREWKELFPEEYKKKREHEENARKQIERLVANGLYGSNIYSTYESMSSLLNSYSHTWTSADSTSALENTEWYDSMFNSRNRPF